MWEKDLTAAQKFHINKYKMDKAAGSTLTTTSDIFSGKISFTWTPSDNTTNYVVKVEKEKVWEGDAYKVFHTTGTSWSVSLPDETYQAYVDSCSNYSYTASDIVSFSAAKIETYHLTVDPNAGTQKTRRDIRKKTP